MRKLILVSVPVALCLGAYGLAWRPLVMREADLKKEHDVGQHSERGLDVGDASRDRAKVDYSLPALDAHGCKGIREIARPELVKLMTKFRPLSQDENANLHRGCPGFACVYQGLGLTRWPELARRTVAYLSLN